MILRRTMLTVFWMVTGIVVFTTLAPLTDRQDWWIRGWDFPRVHIAVVGILTALAGILVRRVSVMIGIAMLIVCASYQAYRVFPYTSWASEEIALRSNVDLQDQVSLIAANVLMQNTDHQAVNSMIEGEQPDVLFLMVTDNAWIDALSPVLKNYKTVVSHPLDNHYGLLFATNLPVTSAKVVFLSDDNTPAVLADLEGPTGKFFFVGLHPRPPVPGQDTDEQIKRAVLLADRKVLPVVAMGDFNDVAWSWTSERFKEYGEFRDPRIGRGMIPSFDATSLWMRFPIDQLYLTDGLDLVSFSRLDPVGSDHFPMKAVISVAP